MSVNIHTPVCHNLYGKGEVVKVTDDNIYVQFEKKQRVFPYPEAFEKGYLSADVEIESTENDSVSASTKKMSDDSRKIVKKLSKQETAETFNSLTKEYGVLDSSKSGGGHDRFRLGKEGASKPLFLACSRVGWMCVYVEGNEKMLLENNGFPCTPTRDDEDYEYKTRVNAEDFEEFL